MKWNWSHMKGDKQSSIVTSLQRTTTDYTFRHNLSNILTNIQNISYTNQNIGQGNQ